MSKRIALSLMLASLSALASSCKDNGEPDAYGNFEAEEVVVSAEAGGQLEWFTPVEGMRLAANATVGLIDNTDGTRVQQLVAQREGIRSDWRSNTDITCSRCSAASRGAITANAAAYSRARNWPQLDQERD